MKPVRFIHCADLHLGTPFKGISELSPDIGNLLYQSTYASFDNIVSLAIKENVDCVLIAGDVYDCEDKSLKAQLRFREGLSQLSEAGIASFIAYGNHDPLNGWSATLKWPNKVFTFPGDKVGCIPLQVNGETIANIYGISFAKPDIRDNLSLKFTPSDEHLPKIGLLHSNVGTNTGYEPYAPCAIEDLTGTNIDYWALGHVHDCKILRSEKPSIVYPGCSQSRSPRETGPKGCYLVTLDFGSDPQIKFVSTDKVRYESKYIDISTCLSFDEVIGSVVDTCQEMSEKSDGRGLLIRAHLRGTTILHSQIQRANSISDMLSSIREQLAIREPWIWVDRLNVETASPYNLDSLRQGNNFIADIISVFDELENPVSQDQEEFCKIFKPLFVKWPGHSYLEELPQETLKEIAGESRSQLIEMLRKET